MDFSFSDDQIMFQEAVRDLLANECPPEVVRAAWENDTGRSDGLWGALAEMGVVGMTAPESAGGLGMDETDLVLLLEEAGRAALPELEHTAVGIPTLAEAGGPVAEAWLERAAAGEATWVQVLKTDTRWERQRAMWCFSSASKFGLSRWTERRWSSTDRSTGPGGCSK